MPLPAHAPVTATFSETERGRFRALLWGEYLAYYTTSAAFLATPLLSIPSPVPKDTLLHAALETAAFTGIGASYAFNLAQKNLAHHRGSLAKFFCQASNAALVAGVAAPILLFPNSVAKILRGLK